MDPLRPRWYPMHMKALVLLALSSTALADPVVLGTPPPPGPPKLAFPSSAPPKRKPASLKYSPEALSKFVDAIMFDKAGNLDKAAGRYRDSAKLSEQPNTYYNLADVERRRESYEEAIENYEKYLALAPDAADRRDVERAITELKTTPFVAVIDGTTTDAIVLVDSVVIGPSPVVIQLSPGHHHVDRISPAGYRGSSVEAKPGEHQHMIMNPLNEDKPETGNVVMAGTPAITTSGSWRDDKTGIEYRLPGRFTLAPGRHETVLWEPGRACDKIVFDVPQTKDLFYVFLDARVPARPGGCIPLKVRTQILKVVGS